MSKLPSAKLVSYCCVSMLNVKKDEYHVVMKLSDIHSSDPKSQLHLPMTA